MFVDLVGYSAMMTRDQESAIGYVRELKTQHLEPIAVEHDGEILKRMGDGWIIAFPSVSAAVDCAYRVQTGLRDNRSIKLRIGCHIGEIVEDEDDFYGAGLNIAQRIQTEAPPGGLMISEDLYRQLSDERRKGLSDAGTFNLKNISQPVRLYQWRPTPGVSRKLDDVPAIAVQPIQFAPADAETESVAGDIRDQLIVRMSRRKGVMVFDGSAKATDEATYDLRARLRMSGGKGRLTLTLLLRDEGRPVWSETYEAPTEDVFRFCDEVLELAEGDLRLQTNAFDGDRLASLADDDLSVSELRARAANEFYKVTTESWTRGLSLMERALALNPLDGVSLAMRAEGQIMLHASRYEVMSPDLVETLVSDLDTAVMQVPRSDYVFWTRGLVRLTLLDDISGARSDLQRSIEVNPAYLENYELDGHIKMRQGEFESADAAFSRLIERGAQNPLQPYRLFLRGVARFCVGNYEGSERDAAAAADLRPNEAGHLKLRSLALRQMGRPEEAERFSSLAQKLSTAPMITTRRPVLPPEFGWLSDELKPGIT
jgi:TolB-like protein